MQISSFSLDLYEVRTLRDERGPLAGIYTRESTGNGLSGQLLKLCHRGRGAPAFSVRTLCFEGWIAGSSPAMTTIISGYLISLFYLPLYLFFQGLKTVARVFIEVFRRMIIEFSYFFLAPCFDKKKPPEVFFLAVEIKNCTDTVAMIRPQSGLF